MGLIVDATQERPVFSNSETSPPRSERSFGAPGRLPFGREPERARRPGREPAVAPPSSDASARPGPERPRQGAGL